VPRGAYHFYYFCRPAAEQAAWYIDNVPREKAPRCRPCSTWSGIRIRRPASCDLLGSIVRSEMKIFLDKVERHYGKKPIIYTSIDFFEDNDLVNFRGYPYWLRSVAGHPTSRYGEHPFTFWQYTGTGVVPGIRRQCRHQRVQRYASRVEKVAGAEHTLTRS
jgi:lysozyme